MTTRRIYPGVSLSPEDAADAYTVRAATNYAQNPRCAVSTGSWGFSGGALSRVASGGPSDEIPTFARLTVSAAGTVHINGNTANGAGPYNTVDPGDIGDEFRFWVWGRSSRALNARAAIGATNSSGSFVGTSAYSDYIALDANEWTPLPVVARTLDPTTARLQLLAQLVGAQVGDTWDVTAMFCAKTEDLHGIVPPYRDGDYPGWEWAGTPHSSRSTGPIGIG